MKKKYLAVAALSMALAGGSAMTSFAAGFVHTSQGTKYQWGSGDYCTNNWVNSVSYTHLPVTERFSAIRSRLSSEAVMWLWRMPFSWHVCAARYI